MTPDDILANAERLITDARHLHDVGRSRSAATLVVVALEQFGSFVEELTKEKFPHAVVHMGIFGRKKTRMLSGKMCWPVTSTTL
jgi:AbiV